MNTANDRATGARPLLELRGCTMEFPGVKALDGVSLRVRRGTVHALMGENGAGKSTLMKVLTGIYTKDSGTITYEGREVEFHNPKEAQEAGIVIVHQELNMMNHLTVAQNMFIGREFKKSGIIDDKKMEQIKSARPTSAVLQMFADAKLDEVVLIYSKATSQEKQDGYKKL